MYCFVRSGKISVKAKYVYLIFSEDPKAFYIGQTQSAYGALGRLTQHMSETYSNTFIQKVLKFYDFDEVNLKKIHFFCFQIKDDANINSTAHLESVEFLVSEEFKKRIFKNGYSISLLSRVDYGGYEHLENIKSLSLTIVEEFLIELEKILSFAEN